MVNVHSDYERMEVKHTSQDMVPPLGRLAHEVTLRDDVTQEPSCMRFYASYVDACQYEGLEIAIDRSDPDGPSLRIRALAAGVGVRRDVGVAQQPGGRLVLYYGGREIGTIVSGDAVLGIAPGRVS